MFVSTAEAPSSVAALRSFPGQWTIRCNTFRGSSALGPLSSWLQWYCLWLRDYHVTVSGSFLLLCVLCWSSRLQGCHLRITNMPSLAICTSCKGSQDQKCLGPCQQGLQAALFVPTLSPWLSVPKQKQKEEFCVSICHSQIPSPAGIHFPSQS